MNNKKYNIFIFLFVCSIYITIPFILLNYYIISKPLLLILYIVYFLLSLITIIAIYNKKYVKFNMIVLPIMIFGMYFLVNQPLLVPILFTVPLLFTSLYQVAFRVFYGILLIILVFINLVFLPISNFGEHTTVDQEMAPNNQYRLVEKQIDQGLLGGDKQVILEKVTFGVISKPIKVVYKGEWTENITIQWVDDSSYNVNGKVKSVFD